MVGGVSFNDESNMAPGICIHLSTGTEEEKEPATFFLKKGAVVTESQETHAEEKKHVKIQLAERFKLFYWTYSKDLEEEDAGEGLFSSAEQDCVVYSAVREWSQSVPSQHRAGTT